MNEFYFCLVHAGMFFRPISDVPMPYCDNKEGQRDGYGKRGSPSPMNHRPRNGNWSESSTQTETADLQAAGEAALFQSRPGCDDSSYVRASCRLTDAGKKADQPKGCERTDSRHRGKSRHQDHGSRSDCKT